MPNAPRAHPIITCVTFALCGGAWAQESTDPQGYFNLEARTTFHFTADGITPAMAMQMPEGKGSRYQTTYKAGDGSIDIYFAADKPEGVPEQNWIPTLPDRGFFAYIRYYGPLKAFNDKTWVPNDVVQVK